MTRRWTVAEEHFAVRYDGDAIRDARIDARELGMSLVGLADLLKAVQSTQDGLKKEAPVSLDIHATEDGSFIVELILVGAGDLWDYAKHLLTGPDMNAVANLTVLLGVTQGVLRWIARHGVPTIERHEQIDAGTVRVWEPDGTTIEMPAEVFLAIRSNAVLDAAEQAVQPLEQDGIDSLEISSKKTVEQKVVITKEDLPKFARPAVDDREVVSDSTEDTWVNFVGVSLDGSGKYRVDDGEGEYQATLADAEFLEAVLNGRVQFGAGDEVSVFMRHEQYRTKKQIRTRHRIERVHKLRRPGSSSPIWDESRDRQRG